MVARGSEEALMGFPVRLCALIGRFSDPRVAESVEALVPHLLSRHVQVLICEEETSFTDRSPGIVRMPEKEIGGAADLVIAIGGDGTLLYAAGLVARHKVPLLGVNRGRLGFLTDVMPQNMFPCIDAAIQGRLQADERPLLAASLHNNASGVVYEALAMNDVVMQKIVTGRMLDFETHLDGNYVNTHAGDGIVVASPTGSTAYALSCGGPIIEPHLDVLVVAPICPHTLSDRPIVISAQSQVEVRLLERPDTRAQVTCDGIELGEFEPGDRLRIRAASERITLLHPAGYDYYALLRSKLHWGRGNSGR
jgi:NAD+ kinase